jgi:hypothetical protein
MPKALKIHHDLFDKTREEKIVFWDHSNNDRYPMKATIWGLNVLETDLYVVMCWWDPDIDDAHEREENAEFITILKSAIINRYKPEWKTY